MFSVKHIVISVIVISAALLSCVRKLGDVPVLVVSIEPQRYVLEKLVGNRYKVVTLLPNGANPESFDPGIPTLRQVEECGAFFKIGYMPFESHIVEKLPELKVFDTSEGVREIHGTHGHDGHVDDVDPHIWSSVGNMRVIASNMYKALCGLDPSNELEYEANFNAFSSELDSISGLLDSLLLPVRGSAFLIWHPSLSYFAEEYGLEQIAVGNEHKENSIGSLRDKIDEAKGRNVKVFFVQKEYDSGQTASVAKEVDARCVALNPLSYDWKKEMLSIGEALSQ